MPRKPGLVTVAGKGDYRETLVALRDRLAVEIERSEGAPVASLARQLTDVLKTLDGLTEPEVSAVDDIARQRAKRRGAGSSDVAGGKVGGGSRGGRARGERRAGS